MARIDFEIEGMTELVNAVERLGELPRKTVRGAARKGANIALKSARQLAPVKTKALRKGLKLSEEKIRNKSKAVFDVKPDKNKNALFVKESKGKRYYYPASMEYGFIKRDGTTRHPGFHYLREALTRNKDQIEREVIQELTKRVDQEWAKKG